MNSPFANQIQNRNFLSPVGFKFVLSKNPIVSFFCNSAKIPEISLQLSSQPSYLKDLDIPGTKILYGDLNISFLVDEDLVNYMLIHNWITGLGFPETTEQYKNLITDKNENINRLNAFSDGSLHILDSNYNINSTVIFKDLFPVLLSPLDFKSTETDINYLTADITFKYTIYNIYDKQGNRL